MFCLQNAFLRLSAFFCLNPNLRKTNTNLYTFEGHGHYQFEFKKRVISYMKNIKKFKKPLKCVYHPQTVHLKVTQKIHIFMQRHAKHKSLRQTLHIRYVKTKLSY